MIGFMGFFSLSQHSRLPDLDEDVPLTQQRSH